MIGPDRRSALRLLLLLAASPALGRDNGSTEKAVIPLDGRRIAIAFEATSLDLWTIGGRFERAWGEIEIDRGVPQRSRLKVVASTASISTGSPARDAVLRSPEFFDAGRFPHVGFESTSIVLADAASGTVSGKLSMHGVTRNVSFAFRVHPARAGGDLPFGRLEATGRVRRSEWGMSALIPVVGDEVRLRLRADVEP